MRAPAASHAVPRSVRTRRHRDGTVAAWDVSPSRRGEGIVRERAGSRLFMDSRPASGADQRRVGDAYHAHLRRLADACRANMRRMIVAVAGLATVPAFATPAAPGIILLPRVIARADAGFSPKSLASALAPCRYERALLFHASTHAWLCPDAATAVGVATRAAKAPGIAWAEADRVMPLEERESRPRLEPLFPAQWHLENTGQSGGTAGADSGAARAWETTTGSPAIIVAALDLGFEEDHPDLRDAWAVNPREVPGNRRDDDGNGLVDDVTGWNFSVNGPNLLYGRNNNHGTAVAGIIGARANGQGVTGLCPDCRVLPIVIDGTASRDAEAIRYAASRGASVLTNSWGYRIGGSGTRVVEEALRDVARQGRDGKGIPILFAMNNAHVDGCRGESPDIAGHPDVIAVSSVDHDDRKVPDAGYGACLKIVASSAPYPSGPRGILTTDRQGDKGYNAAGATDNVADTSYTNNFSGTSAAAPVVAGALGLLLSHDPTLTAQDVMALVYASAAKVHPDEARYDPVTGHSKEYGHGRLDVGAAMRALTSRTAP